jgi:hypothetical protein
MQKQTKNRHSKAGAVSKNEKRNLIRQKHTHSHHQRKGNAYIFIMQI